MTHAVAVRKANEVSTETLSEAAEQYRRGSKAAATMKAYGFDLKDFAAWCEEQGTGFLPATPRAVADYLTHLATVKGYKAATLQRRISAISQLHQAHEYESPTQSHVVCSVMAGIRRKHGTAQKGKAALRTDDLRRMVEALPDSLLGIRDRALLVVGFAKAFRRSELVGLDVEDVEFSKEGLIVTLRRSKTDQEGQGARFGIPYGSNPLTCPVRALQEWLWRSGIESGPLFRPINRHGHIQPKRLSDKAVARIVKRSAKAVGLDPADYAGHSLRAGFATEAASRGVSERAIMRQTGHKSLTTVRRYIREGSMFQDNAAAQVGL